MDAFPRFRLIVKRLNLVGLLVALVLGLLPNLALAAELRGGDNVLVGPGQTITDDLYVAGGTISVFGTIRGDLVVTGGTVTVNGPVEGDVIAMAGTTTLQGPIGRNVRALGGTIVIANTVAQDVVVAGGSLTLGPQSRVGRDVVAGTGTAIIDGAVTRDVTVNAGDLTLNGPVGGNVRFDGSSLNLGSSAKVTGNLTYSSDNGLGSSAASVVKGQIVRQPRAALAPAPTPVERAASGTIGWLRAVVGLFVLGLALILLFPAFGRRTSATLKQSPVASLIIGLVTLIVFPFLAAFIFALGLLVGGWWLALFGLAVYGLTLAVGMTVAALFVGTRIVALGRGTGVSPVWALLLGTVVLLLVGLVPIVGGLVVFVALLFGFGSLLLAGYQVYVETLPAPVNEKETRGGPQLNAVA